MLEMDVRVIPLKLLEFRYGSLFPKPTPRSLILTSLLKDNVAPVTFSSKFFHSSSSIAKENA